MLKNTADNKQKKMTNESVKYIVFEQNRHKKESTGIALKRGRKCFRYGKSLSAVDLSFKSQG